MSNLDPFTLAIGGFVAMLIVLGLVRYFTGAISRRWNRHKAETVEQWAAEGIEFIRGPTGGQFSGLESMGVTRVIAGIGFVALTTNDLRVTRATPSAAWCIGYRQIKGVTIQPTFLGQRSKKTPFIVARFTQESDKIGFQVKDFEEWATALAKAARVRVKDLRKEKSR